MFDLIEKDKKILRDKKKQNDKSFFNIKGYLGLFTRSKTEKLSDDLVYESPHNCITWAVRKVNNILVQLPLIKGLYTTPKDITNISRSSFEQKSKIL